MRVSVGADHAGFPLKQRVIDAVEKLGHTVIDCGTDSTDPVDFPDITQATCAPVLDGSADRAVLVCGTGAGAIMAANKIPGIRCGLANESYSAHQAVEHDDANVIALGAWLVPSAFIDDIVAQFLAATFDDDADTRRRVAKLNALDALVPVSATPIAANH
ncbi:RpiB/LacA/LacB family sugar-phosphate isomerase [Leifsonia sp. NPDC058230]|uniref:RpiB/LacA/LacB family sugar-phosphate isomerase n=1 Tax=Leifsonia sp. NPDC058230 TaxID=3346391 RepID=UPI0036DA48F5